MSEVAEHSDQAKRRRQSIENLAEELLHDIAARLPFRSLSSAKAALPRLRDIGPLDERWLRNYYSRSATPAYLMLVRQATVTDSADQFLVCDHDGNFHHDMSFKVGPRGHIQLESAASNGLLWISVTKDSLGQNIPNSHYWTSFVVNPASQTMVPVPLPPLQSGGDYGRCMRFDPVTAACTLVQVRVSINNATQDTEEEDLVDVVIDVLKLSSGNETLQWDTVPLPQTTASCVLKLGGFILDHGEIKVVSSGNYFFWSYECLEKGTLKVMIFNSVDLSLDSVQFPQCRFSNCRACIRPDLMSFSCNWLLCEVGGRIMLIHMDVHYNGRRCTDFWKLSHVEGLWEWQSMDNKSSVNLSNDYNLHFLLSKASTWELFLRPFRYAAFGEYTVKVQGFNHEMVKVYDKHGDIVRRISIQGLDTMLNCQSRGPIDGRELEKYDPKLPLPNLEVVGVWAFENNNIVWPFPRNDSHSHLIFCPRQHV